MTFGSSSLAGNALRHFLCLRPAFSPTLRPCHMANYIPRMTATPPRNNRLWHPSRGISFSPASSASPATPARTARPVVEVSVRASQYRHASTSQPVSSHSEAWTKASLQQSATGITRVSYAYRRLNLQQSAEQADEHVSVDIAEEAAEELAPEPEELAPEPEELAPEPEELAPEPEELVPEPEESESEEEEERKKDTDSPPPPVFEYKIVDDLFHAAKRSPPGSPESFWSYTQYVRTAEDGTSRRPTVHYCRSTHTMERVCQHFMEEKVLGFDLEWVIDSSRWDGVRKNVSLIQLASPSRVALFHLALFPKRDDMVGTSFRRIMENPEIMKVGVAIKGDATRLRKFLDIESRGLIELSHLYRLVTYSQTGEYHKINRKLVPLATQVEEYLHLPLFKGQDVRSGDWSDSLNTDQVRYSASDAYAGLQLYATLDHYRKQLDPCPPHPYHAELNKAIRLADGVNVLETDQEIVDTEGDATTSVKKRRTRAVKPAERPKDSRVEIANDKAVSYRMSHPKSRATLAQLRAYYLWHCYDLTPSAVAELLRDPPLQTNTVTKYILATLQSEKFVADGDRLHEITYDISLSTLWSKWPSVAVVVDAAVEPRVAG
ncbi:ribonuclease H-like protein [Xylaria intraflava]|nr:ribonuclease H-like protein [Xylaria intraflava]